MTQRPIIDAGPSLNFLSINQERLLIATLGKLSAPATVGEEVLRKAAQDPRFRPAETAWKKPRTGSRPFPTMSPPTCPES